MIWSYLVMVWLWMSPYCWLDNELSQDIISRILFFYSQQKENKSRNLKLWWHDREHKTSLEHLLQIGYGYDQGIIIEGETIFFATFRHTLRCFFPIFCIQVTIEKRKNVFCNCFQFLCRIIAMLPSKYYDVHSIPCSKWTPFRVVLWLRRSIYFQYVLSCIRKNDKIGDDNTFEIYHILYDYCHSVFMWMLLNMRLLTDFCLLSPNF